MKNMLGPTRGGIVLAIPMLAALLQVAPARAQLSGQVDLAELGIAFTIPDKWVGQLTDEAFVMGGLEEPGLILMIQHHYRTLDEVRAEARKGIDEGPIKLSPAGEMAAIGDRALGGEFRGTIEGTPARVYLVGVLNPHGDGVSVMALTDEANFSPRYEQLARQVAASLVFSKVEATPAVQQAQQLLTNTRLSFRESYSSSPSSGGGGYSSYGGYSIRRHIDLCPGQRFRSSDSSQVNVDTGGAYGYGRGGGEGAGTWSVVPQGAGGTALELRFDDGTVRRYALSFQDGKTFLDGERYFRIGAGDPHGNGPQCH
jgi:hypothetical protein